MREVYLGETIKQRRMELGLTQEELCEGICDPVTISRIENGRQTPSRNRINALLQRLGLPNDRYYALLSKHEMELDSLRKELHHRTTYFEQASDEIRNSARLRALETLQKLEAIMDADDQITRQQILSNRVTLGNTDGPYNCEERLNLLMEAIYLTVPRFDLKEICERHYTTDETRIINQIAATYAMAGQRNEAINIYSQLLNYVQKCNQYLARYAGQLALITYNYSINLALEKCYEEAIEIADLGRCTCIEYGHYQFLPGHLAVMAECYYFMGETERSATLYCQAHCLYKAVGDEHNLKIIDAEMKEHIKITLPF